MQNTKYQKLWIVVVALTYYVAAYLSLQLAVPHTNSSPVWPPAGIAFVAMWVLGYRIWPAICLGAFLANMTVFFQGHWGDFPLTFLVSLVIGVGNTLEALTAVFILRSFTDAENPLFKVRDVFKFVFAALVAALSSSIVGTLAVCTAKHINGPLFQIIWFTWWLGDVVGILIVAAIFFAFYKRPWEVYHWRKIAEALAGILVLVALDIGVFNGKFVSTQFYFPAGYLILPLLIWATYRFGHIGAVVSLLVTLIIAVGGTIHQLGPFVSDVLNKALIVLEVFMGILTVTVLVFAAALEERRESEERVRRSEEYFRTLVENSLDMVALLNMQGKVIYASASIKNVLDYTPKEKIGHSIFEWIHPDDHAFVLGRIQEILKTPGAITDAQCRFRHKDGSWRWLEGTGRNLLHEPTINAIVVNYRDITEKRKAQEDQLYLASIVENADEAITAKSLDGIITSWNKGAERLYGYTYEEAIGRPASILVPDDRKEEMAGIFYRLRKGGRIERLETKRRCKNGAIIDVSLIISLIKNASGELLGFSSMAHNITERKYVEEILKRDRDSLEKLVDERSKELIRTQKELKQASRLADIGTLAATVAHELRNPLGVIQVAAYNLKASMKELEPNQHLKNIEKKIWEGNQIIDNLLSYSRIKIPSYEQISIVNIVDECLATAAQRFKDKGVVVHKAYSMDGVDLIEADPNQIREIFINILNNAYQAFTGVNGRIEVGINAKGGMVEVRIKDTGVGIAPEDLKQVFEPFFTRKAKGTGLGMTICSELVNLHQGKIDIESQQGVGTIVRVILPIQRAGL